MSNQTDLISEVKAVLTHYTEEDKHYGEPAMKALEALECISIQLSTTERQRDEAVKALTEILDNTDPEDWYYGGVHREASEVLERIKGVAQAGGHQSTESPSDSGSRIGLGGSYE